MYKLIILFLTAFVITSVQAAPFADDFESYIAGNDIITEGGGLYTKPGGADAGIVVEMFDPENSTQAVRHQQGADPNVINMTRIVSSFVDPQIVGKVKFEIDLKPVSGKHTIYIWKTEASDDYEAGFQLSFYEILGGTQWVLKASSEDNQRATQFTLRTPAGETARLYPNNWYRFTAIVYEDTTLGDRERYVDLEVQDLTNGGVAAQLIRWPANLNPAYIRGGQIISSKSDHDTGLYEVYIDNWNFTEYAANCEDMINFGTPLDADLNGDCKVDFSDFAIFGQSWLDTCNEPGNGSCIENW